MTSVKRRPSFLQRIMGPSLSRRGSGSTLVSPGAGDTREVRDYGSGEESDTGHQNQSYINHI